MAARVRETNRWDAVINSVNYRLKRAEGSYRKVSGRSMLEIQQMLNQAGNQFTSRRDLRTLFQTDWSGGSQWHKPLLSDQSVDSYNVSQGFDMVTEPGNIFSQADTIQVGSSSTLDDITPMLQVASDEIYYFKKGGTWKGLIKWGGSSFSSLTNEFGSNSTPMEMCWDAESSTIYALFLDGNIKLVVPDTSSAGLIDIGTCVQGSNIFFHFGRLIAYDGNQLHEITDYNNVPSQADVVIFDDGMGPDLLTKVDITSGDPVFGKYSHRLAAASAEGVWLVKNVEQGGGSTPFIYRVDRTNDGTNVGVPVATLPQGTIVLDIAYHLGSLIMATANDVVQVLGNDISSYGYPQITFYHLTNDSLGTIGSPYGGLAPTDAPYRFLGTDKARVFIGGVSSVWVYDPIRGGLHTWVENTYAAAAGGPFMGMAKTTNAGGDKIHMFHHFNSSTVLQLPLEDEGGATDTHTLESNYIDGNLPSELKSLVGITLMTDGIKANEVWTVSIEADDGSFASAAVFDVDDTKTLYKALAAAVTGYRFRYKIAWTASEDITTPSRVKGIVLHMVQGEMVTAWQLTLDLNEVRSIENTVLRPEDVLGDLETLMGKQVMTTYVDEMRLTSSTHDVRVDSVQVSRDTPLEGEAVVVLTEQDLNN